MGLFNKIFKKEKKKKSKEIKEESNAFALDPFEDLEKYDGPGIGCSYCNKEIETWQKRKTLGKDKYHVKCLRKMKKQLRGVI